MRNFLLCKTWRSVQKGLFRKRTAANKRRNQLIVWLQFCLHSPLLDGTWKVFDSKSLSVLFAKDVLFQKFQLLLLANTIRRTSRGIISGVALRVIYSTKLITAPGFHTLNEIRTLLEHCITCERLLCGYKYNLLNTSHICIEIIRAEARRLLSNARGSAREFVLARRFASTREFSSRKLELRQFRTGYEFIQGREN